MRLWQRTLGFALGICVLAGIVTAAAAVEKTNPLIFPDQKMQVPSYPDIIINVLLLGIHFGKDGYWGSGLKDTITDCHTDAVMVVAFNLTKNKIDIISIPRDSVTIVPGGRGIYKLNAAVNCADTLLEGLERTQASVERLLGSVKIDSYFAVDMGAMITLGNALGGVDYEVDMTYRGDSFTLYEKGWQHLDGKGIMDYVRARKNATIDGTDLGRTRRQREMMTAIMQKLMRDTKSAMNVLDALANPANGVVTSMTGTQAVGFLSILPLLWQRDGPLITSYTLTGGYSTAMGWNFAFTNEAYRAELLKTVYGVDVPPLQYVSRAHADFYTDSGFYSMHVINICTEFISNAKALHPKFSAEQRDMWEQLLAAYDEAVDWLQGAWNTLASNDITEMKYARVRMRDLAAALAASIGYKGDLPWDYYPPEWYNDPYTNEYQLDWR
jgi:LCP family protein required for cell wall assembly